MLRAHIQGREIEDSPPSNRVLDGRAGGGLCGFEREHGAPGTIRLIHSGARTREMSGGVESTGARHQYVGAGNSPFPANELYAGRRAFEGARFGN